MENENKQDVLKEVESTITEMENVSTKEERNEEVKEEAVSTSKREYVPNRFEFALYVNDSPICKRNFKINYFNEQGLYSLQMKSQLDNIVRMIHNDLQSKSRLYLWYNTYDDSREGELYEPLMDEWKCTFKIVISDNGKEMLSKIWDGRYYPRAIREKVDLSNKFIEINGKKIELSEIDEKRLPIEGYVNRIIVGGRPDLIVQIIKMICEVCSPEEVTVDEDGTVHKSGDFASEQDYELFDVYNTTAQIMKDGKFLGYEVVDSKKYIFSKFQRYMKMCSDLSVGNNEKTKHYFDVECNGMFNSFRNRKF